MMELELIGLTKVFGAKKAVDQVSLVIELKGVVGLLGPNGAGKTTLMRMITGYLNPSEGEIRLNNEKVDTRVTSYKSIIGYLPENNPLYTNLTVGEFLVMAAEIKGLKNAKTEVLKVASECGLDQVLGQKIETMSRGYKQRVGLAGAIMGSPKLLILDEPTSGLDPNQIVEIRKLIEKLAKKRGVILSTHILPEAKQVCSRLLIISQGKIVMDAETRDVKNLEKKFVDLTSK
jgi:ABC-2 type transport system ATP-binding protein